MEWGTIFYWTGAVVWVVGGLITLLIILFKLADLDNIDADTMKEELKKFDNDFGLWKAERRKGPSKDNPLL